MAARNYPKENLIKLTDCLFFTSGNCNRNNSCQFRHCQAAINQSESCPNWPNSCRDVNCPFRHPKLHFPTPKPNPKPAPNSIPNSISKPAPKREGVIAFFWDIENIAIPRGQKPFDIVQRIRHKLVTGPGLQEVGFSCYSNTNTISSDNRQSLDRAGVDLIHIEDRKTNAADRKITRDLTRFERNHRPPATVVLISGDIDFVGMLSDLRYQAGYYVIVIHNKPAKEELKATVNEHYAWELFTEAPSPPPEESYGGMGTFPTTRERTVGPLMGVRPVPVRTTPSYNNKDGTSSNIPAPTGEPRAHIRRTASDVHISKGKTVKSASTVNISSTNNDDVEKESSSVHQCPYCTNEYTMIEALQKHQTDKKHLYDCSVCNSGYRTEIALKQHQSAKGHDSVTIASNHLHDDSLDRF